MRSKPITVIVVDDEERIRRFARHLLETDSALSVIGEADTGRSAAAMVRELSPDVVVMDISMPVMNGLEATRAILRECPDVHVILTTAMGADPYRRVSMSVGASDFLDKSSLDSELIDAVHRTARHGLH